MAQVSVQTLPLGISAETISRLLEDLRRREALLQAIIGRFERRYGVPLEELEARLNQGEGPEHLDWEDSIEWRNAVEALERTKLIRSLLEWVLRSRTPSPASLKNAHTS